MSDLTQNEIDHLLTLMREQAAERHDQDSAFTTNELVLASGWPRERVRRLMQPLIKRGLVRPVKVTRLNNWGEPYRPHAYEIAEGDEAA